MAVQSGAVSGQSIQKLIAPCPSCKISNIEVIITQLKKKEGPRWGVTLELGNPAACYKTKSTCALCKFICDVDGIESSSLGSSPDRHSGYHKSEHTLRLKFWGGDWYSGMDIQSEIPAAACGALIGCCYSSSVAIFLEQNGEFTESICPRTLSPETPAGNMDYRLLRKWVGYCESKHSSGPCCNQNETQSLGDFHLIDVRSQQIVRVRTRTRYAALSYVWGHRVGQNVGEHNYRIDGGRWSPVLPHALPGTLPQTIADALIVTRELGLPYLWVDLFCIDQQDAQHLQDQVSKMDKIYAGAHMTIIALDGADADAGLAGVSRPLQQKQQPRYRTDGGTLVACCLPTSSWKLSSKPWNQRAWTMQEHLFSRRRLIIDSHQVIWKCRTEYLHDCLPAPDPQADWTFTKRHEWFSFDCDSVDLDKKDSYFAAFSDILSVYTARRLGTQTDVLNACQCMLTHLTRGTKDKWIFAHPSSYMLPSLLWEPHCKSYPKRHGQFPSWSWLGWQASLEYSWWLHNVELNRTLAKLPDLPRRKREFRPNKRYGHNKRYRHNKEYRPNKRYDGAYDWVPIGWREMMKMSNSTVPAPIDRDNMTASWSVSESKLILDTCVSTWVVATVRRDGDPIKFKPDSPPLSEVAIGDHWTFLDETGQALENPLGEHTIFWTADYFFRTSPEISKTIGKEVIIATVDFYDHIVDSELSLLEAKNIVAGLVLMPRSDGTMLRVASVAMPWYYFQHAPRQRSRVVIV